MLTVCILSRYRKDTEALYHSFMYSLVSLISGIYPLPAMHSLLVTLKSNKTSCQFICLEYKTKLEIVAGGHSAPLTVH